MNTDIVRQVLVDQYEVIRPIAWSNQFGSAGPLEIEIGCGNGEFLARQALEARGRNFLGIEQSWECIQRASRKIFQAGVPNARLVQADVRVALERLFARESVDGMCALFPCPWPKKAHVKHRLFSSDFLRLANSRLKAKGALKIVTDFKPYYQWVLEQSEKTGFAVKTKAVAPSYGTKYERKWMGQGQKDFFEIIFSKTKDIDVPVKEDAVLKSYALENFDPDKFAFEDAHGAAAVVLKEFVYDPKRKTAILRLLVAEGPLVQNLWVAIVYKDKQWLIVPAQGNKFIPSDGIAQALALVYQACRRTMVKI